MMTPDDDDDETDGRACAWRERAKVERAPAAADSLSFAACFARFRTTPAPLLFSSTMRRSAAALLVRAARAAEGRGE